MILSISNLRSIPQAVSFDTAARKSVSEDSFEKVTGSNSWKNRGSAAKGAAPVGKECTSSSCAKAAPSPVQQDAVQQFPAAKAAPVQQSPAQEQFPAKGGIEQDAKEPVEF